MTPEAFSTKIKISEHQRASNTMGPESNTKEAIDRTARLDTRH